MKKIIFVKNVFLFLLVQFILTNSYSTATTQHSLKQEESNAQPALLNSASKSVKTLQETIKDIESLMPDLKTEMEKRFKKLEKISALDKKDPNRKIKKAKKAYEEVKKTFENNKNDIEVLNDISSELKKITKKPDSGRFEIEDFTTDREQEFIKIAHKIRAEEGLKDENLVSEKKDQSSVALSGDDERLRPADQFQIRRGEYILNVSGELSFDTDLKFNRNLISNKNRNKAEFAPELELNLNLTLPNKNFIYTQFSLEEEIEFKNSNTPDFSLDIQLDEAFLELQSFLHPDLTFSIGRQQIFEARRWLYNEKIDSAKLHFHLSSFVFDVVLSPDIDFISYVSYEFAKKSEIAGYVIFRDNEPAGTDSPVWVGLRSFGTLKNGGAEVKYWFEGAYVTGSVNTKPAQDVSGFAVDIGNTYIFRKVRFKPSFTVGYAFGSGDGNSGDSTDHNFRQTGLHSNKAKFGGISNFEYYGVLFDPELSNMHILTAGIGMRPNKKSSIDIVYHYYLQHKASKVIRDSDLKADPTGIDKELGHETDLILGYKGFKNVKLRLKSGYFIPGDGFIENDPAFLLSFDVKYAF